MSKKYPGVSRIDSGATHGFFVRVYRAGKTYPKFFADKKCGGKGKALALALKAHKDLLEKVGPKAITPRIRSGKTKNTTGIIGVNRFKRKDGKGSSIDCFVVSYRPEPNLPRQKVFSIAKWGEDRALALAIAFRRKMEEEIRRGSRD